MMDPLAQTLALSALANGGGGGRNPHAITYDEMNLTSAQQKQVRENIAAPAYADIIQPKKIKDYLYEVEFTDIDWEYGKDFERNKRMTTLGACSSARSGNWFGRNYDWNYDETDYYIIRMNRSKTAKYWSIGMTGFTDITPDTYRALPFITLDGINECGVFANINILPSDASYTTTGTTPLVSWEDTLGAVMLPRFILDNFATAEEAVEYIQNYISVYCKEYEELHLMIGDSTTTYLMEFIDNAIVVTEMTERPYMTNFYLQGSEVDPDGHIDYDTVGDYSFGLERYDMLADGISDADSLEGMTALMNSINWTNAYSTEMDPIWKTEFVTPELGLTIHSSLEDFAEVLEYERGLFADRTRDGQTWQTCHTTVYDIQNKVMYLQTQEDAEQIKVEYQASGGGGDVVPNPELDGTEELLNGLKVGEQKFKVPESSCRIQMENLSVDDFNAFGSPYKKSDSKNLYIPFVLGSFFGNLFYNINSTVPFMTDEITIIKQQRDRNMMCDCHKYFSQIFNLIARGNDKVRIFKESTVIEDLEIPVIILYIQTKVRNRTISNSYILLNKFIVFDYSALGSPMNLYTTAPISLFESSDTSFLYDTDTYPNMFSSIDEIKAATPLSDIPDGDYETLDQYSIRFVVDRESDLSNVPTTTGDYFVKTYVDEESGEFGSSYEPYVIPTAPTTDGSYQLTCDVVNGVVTYSWK